MAGAGAGADGGAVLMGAVRVEADVGVDDCMWGLPHADTPVKAGPEPTPAGTTAGRDRCGETLDIRRDCCRAKPWVAQVLLCASWPSAPGVDDDAGPWVWRHTE